MATNYQFLQRPHGSDPEMLLQWLDTIFRNPRYGDWTPSITFVTPGDLTVVYSTQSGRYYKHGIIALLTWNIVTSTFTHSTASGNFRLAGSPFTSIDVGGALSVGFGNTRWGGIDKANYTDMLPRMVENTTFINLDASGSGQAPSLVTTADMPTGGTVRLSGFVLFPAFD